MPYLLAGAGAHSTSLKVVSTPFFGYGWSDSGTTETRTLVDSRKLGGAAKAQVGLDVSLGDSATLGGYAALHLAGSTTYAPTRSGTAVGLTGLKGGYTAVSYGLNAGARF